MEQTNTYCGGKHQDSTPWHLYLNLRLHRDAAMLLAAEAIRIVVCGGTRMTGTELILATAAGQRSLVELRMATASTPAACEVEPGPANVEKNP